MSDQDETFQKQADSALADLVMEERLENQRSIIVALENDKKGLSDVITYRDRKIDELEKKLQQVEQAKISWEAKYDDLKAKFDYADDVLKDLHEKLINK